jgi:DNA-binding NarL/FixJ family response regulator
MSQRTKSSGQAIADLTPAVYPRPVRHFAREDSRSAGSAAETRARILVVEDDFLVAMQVEAALVDAGFTLAGTAASGEEAIGIVASARPALVLMDIRLAGKMDGVDAALAVFREHGIRCIFATAHHDPEIRKRAAPAQPLGWLPKPYTMPAMLATVRQALADLEQDTH